MLRIILFLGAFLAMVSNVFTQVNFNKIEKELAYHADIMVNATVAEHRIKAADLFQEQFELMLNTPDSYVHTFESLKWISQLTAEDNKFRIFSWIVADENMISKTYGYLQFADGKIIILNDTGEMNTDLEYEQTSNVDWFGAIYYHIMPFVSYGQTDYILFGYRQISKFDKVKVLEVLSIEEDQVTFGKELFIKEIENERDDIKTRILLTYSADANVTLNYNASMGMIVYDNLIPRMGRIEGQGPTQLPDGSFIGYKQEEDKWIYVDKIFNHISNEAPRPMPVLGSDAETNIFGQSKTKEKKKRN